MSRSSHKNVPPYEAMLLSQVITEKKQLRISFIDGDMLVEKVQWHTSEYIGMKDGKVVNKRAVKYWEILE